MREKRDTLTHLLRDRTVAVTIGRVERLVIAERTTAPPHLAVAVGTGKTRIDGNLLHLAAKDATQITAEFVI